MPTVWPTADSDLPSFLAMAGLTVSDTTQIDVALASAISSFKNMVCYQQFLVGVDNDGQTSTEYYFPNKPMVNLPGFVSISAVKTGVTWTDATVDSSSGTTIYAPNGYRLRRQPNENGPITWMKFVDGCVPRSVAVTGVRGAYNSLPDDVFLAVEQLATMNLIPWLAYGNMGNVAEFEIGNQDLRVKFQDGKLQVLNDARGSIARTMDAYKLKSL